MSAAEMREAAARLCDHEVAAWKVRLEEARTHAEANECEAACDAAEGLANRIRALSLPEEEGMVESRASPENTWSGIRAGLTYEQNALLRAYGAPTYEERERALDQIARDIAERVARLGARAAIRAINGGER